VRGFTLLEVLVVLALLSLLVALAAPQLQRAYLSVAAHGERDSLVGQLASLSLRAQALGVAFELSDDSLGRRLPDGQPLVAVPAGWRLRIDTPIRFNFVGICSGGSVRLLSPSGEQTVIDLEAPACEVRQSQSSAIRS
jgi:prepilin-type N-terminal cleavage/methylation domain-containing protein